jgi:hypothetical protein
MPPKKSEHGASLHGMRAPCKKTPLFLNACYACPEPVLAKRSLLVQNRAKMACSDLVVETEPRSVAPVVSSDGVAHELCCVPEKCAGNAGATCTTEEHRQCQAAAQQSTAELTLRACPIDVRHNTQLTAMSCAALHCAAVDAVLCSALLVLYCAVLCCAVLCCLVLSCAVMCWCWCSAILCWCCPVLPCRVVSCPVLCFNELVLALRCALLCSASAHLRLHRPVRCSC